MGNFSKKIDTRDKGDEMPCGMGKKGEKQDGFQEDKAISHEKEKALVGFSPFLPAPLGAYIYLSFFRLFVLFVKRSGFLF